MDYISLAKENFMHTYSTQELCIDHADGVRVYGTDGKCYLDMVAGIAVNALGYNNKAIKDRAQEVMNDGFFHVSNLYYNKWAPQAASRLNRLSGGSEVFFANSGAEANEAALKAARKYGSRTGRSKVISFEHSFHGRTYGAITLTGQEKYHKGFSPMVPDIVYAEYNNLESVKALADESVCAIILEPVQGEGGIIPAEIGFLKGVRKIADERDLILIFDCVQCGLGRTGRNFAFEHYGVKPDIMTIAKAIGCGLPLSATVAFEKAEGIFSPGDHASTFGGNALSTALSLVLFDALEGGLSSEVEKKGEYFKKGLEEIKRKHPDKCSAVRGLGLMLGLDLKVKPADVIARCRERGLLVCSAGYTVLRFVPPLVIDYTDIDEALAIVDGVLSEI